MLQVFLWDTKPRGFVVPSPLMVVHRCQARVAESSAEDFIDLLFIIGKLFEFAKFCFLGVSSQHDELIFPVEESPSTVLAVAL